MKNNRIMKFIYKPFLLLLLSSIVFVGCNDDNTSSETILGGDTQSNTIYQTQITGAAEKGLFKKGSTVTVEVYKTEKFEELLEIFTGSVTDDTGIFTIEGNIKSKYIKVTVSGTFIDETSGTNEEIQGSVMVLANIEGEGENIVNANILTDLEAEGTLKKIKLGKGFSDAKKEALEEVLSQLGYTPDEIQKVRKKGARKIRLSDLTDSTEEGDILLKVSSLFLETVKEEKESYSDFVRKFKENANDESKSVSLKTMLDKLKAQKEKVVNKLDSIKERIQDIRKHIILIKGKITNKFLQEVYLSNLTPAEGDSLTAEESKEVEQEISTLIKEINNSKIRTFEDVRTTLFGEDINLKTIIEEAIIKRALVNIIKFGNNIDVETAFGENDLGEKKLLYRIKIVKEKDENYLHIYLPKDENFNSIFESIKKEFSTRYEMIIEEVNKS